ncbi:MAG: hypothetical protein WD992_01935 [Candidatus Levyibacteriota bacterium]
MKKTAQKTASTQKFIEIEGIEGNIAYFSGGNASLAIEVTATNFALLSKGEQEAKIASYVAFLNSLSFPIQIFIRNKQLDISSYLKLLEAQEASEQNPLVKERIRLYRGFVGNLVKVNMVLDKNFYIVVSYSHLEKGIGAAAKSMKHGGGPSSDFAGNAKASLHTKAQAIQSQLQSLNLKTKVLSQNELLQLFYEAYNGDPTQTGQANTGTPVVSAKGESSPGQKQQTATL